MHPPNTVHHSLHPCVETRMVLLRCFPIKISTFGWFPYPMKSLVHIHISRKLPPSFYSFRSLPQSQKLLQKIWKSTPSKSTLMAISATWTFFASPAKHQLYRHQLSLRRNSKKNWKLYGRSSQNSQIIPGILQSLLPTIPLPAQAPPPPITALPPSLTPHSPTSILKLSAAPI